MTNSNYNFDEQVNQDDRPTIIMGGQTYKLRYPTLEDIENIDKLKDDEAKTKALYDFVDKIDEKQPDFREILNKQDIRVFKLFSDMIKKEFGISEE